MSSVSIDSQQLVDSLLWRYAVKRFDPTRPLDATTWDAIQKSMVLTPSSFGLQPWKFLVVRSPQIKAKLPDISWKQSQPGDCSHMVVFAAMKIVSPEYVDQFMKKIAATRGVPAESLTSYKQVVLGFLKNIDGNHLSWSMNQVYIALGQLLANAAMLGVDACPMEGIVQKEYDKLLGLEGSNFTCVVGCALGFRHPDDKYSQAAKVRFDAVDIFEYF
ncbi:MAG: NAD(P)H-dependent oxidoreductase [Pirellula sp.]